MELNVRGQFYRDLAHYSNRTLLNDVYELMNEIESAKNISQIHHLQKLIQYKNHYRIRVADDYRIGIIVRGNTIWFVRFAHRNAIYKKFP